MLILRITPGDHVVINDDIVITFTPNSTYVDDKSINLGIDAPVDPQTKRPKYNIRRGHLTRRSRP